MPQNVTHLNKRQTQIVDALRRLGYVAIDDLAQEFSVTQQTIRRDINRLCDLGLMKRFHGGAVQTGQARNIPFDKRQNLLSSEKSLIAERIVSHIPDGSSLFLDVGTSMDAVARALLVRANLRIVTSNLYAAQILGKRDDYDVIATGGVVRPQDGSCVGEEALRSIRQYYMDFAVISTSGINRQGVLLDFDVRKVRVTEAMIERGYQVILSADHSKMDRRAMIQCEPLSKIDILVTDTQPDTWFLKLAQESSTSIEVVS